MNIRSSEFVSVELGIQHVISIHHIFFCGLSGFTVFPHIMSSTARPSIKKSVIERKMRVSIFSKSLSETFLILIRIERDVIKNVNLSSGRVLLIRASF